MTKQALALVGAALCAGCLFAPGRPGHTDSMDAGDASDAGDGGTDCAAATQPAGPLLAASLESGVETIFRLGGPPEAPAIWRFSSDARDTRCPVDTTPLELPASSMAASLDAIAVGRLSTGAPLQVFATISEELRGLASTHGFSDVDHHLTSFTRVDCAACLRGPGTASFIAAVPKTHELWLGSGTTVAVTEITDLALHLAVPAGSGMATPERWNGGAAISNVTDGDVVLFGESYTFRAKTTAAGAYGSILQNPPYYNNGCAGPACAPRVARTLSHLVGGSAPIVGLSASVLHQPDATPEVSLALVRTGAVVVDGMKLPLTQSVSAHILDLDLVQSGTAQVLAVLWSAGDNSGDSTLVLYERVGLNAMMRSAVTVPRSLSRIAFVVHDNLLHLLVVGDEPGRADERCYDVDKVSLTLAGCGP